MYFDSSFRIKYSFHSRIYIYVYIIYLQYMYASYSIKGLNKLTFDGKF